jgi:MarR-like DNA-binding transcriptional regulator SgrR of sgrS sRNA
MQLAEYFFNLYRTLNRDSDKELQFSTNISEISSIFDCTSRNTKYILKEMQNAGWIQWNPKPGRGNHSSLEFLKTDTQLFNKIMKQKIYDGDLFWCFSQVKHFDLSFRNYFINTIYEIFGYQEVQHKDILRLPIRYKLKEIRPVGNHFSEEKQLISQLFDTLIRFDTKTFKPVPHLAHFFETNHSGTEFIFHLRKGIFFHNGKELTGFDVKYTYQYIIDKKEPSLLKQIFLNIKDISVPHPLVVKITMHEPNYLFLTFLSSPEASIVLEDETYGNELPIGTGPYKVAKWENQRVRLEVHPFYFKERAHIDEIEFWTVPEIDLSIHSFLDAAQWVTSNSIEKGAMYLLFNLKNRDNIEWRKNIFTSIDKDGLVNTMGENLFEADTMLENTRSIMTKKIPVKVAHETVNLVTLNGQLYTRTAELLKEQLSKIGIDVNVIIVNNLSSLTSTETLMIGDMFLLKDALDENLEWDFLNILHSDTSVWSLLLNEELAEQKEQILAEIFHEQSVKRRFVKYRQLERLLIENAVVHYLFRNNHSRITYPNLQAHYYGNELPLNQFWFKPQ